MSIKITEKSQCQKIYDVKNSTIGKATEFKESGSSELQNTYVKFGGGTNEGMERRDGALKAESRSPDYFITRFLASLEPFLAALPSSSSRGTS